MRRVAAVVTLVVLAASAVGAAVQNASLPKGSVTVEEVETVVTVATALSSDTLNAAVPSNKSTQDLAYAMH